MKFKYIAGAVAVVVIAVIGLLMTRHNSQTSPIANTPRTTDNTQAISQTQGNTNNSLPSVKIGKIGDSFTEVSDPPNTNLKLKLVQIIDPYTFTYNNYNESGIASKFEVTNMGNQSISWLNVSRFLRAPNVSIEAYKSAENSHVNNGSIQVKTAAIDGINSAVYPCTKGDKLPVDPIPAGAIETGCFVFTNLSNPNPLSLNSIYYSDPNGSPLLGWDVK